MTGEHGDAKKGQVMRVTRRHGCRLPLARDAHDADARRRRAGARPARGHPLALLAVDPLRADPAGHSAAAAPDRPAAAAGPPGAVRAAPPRLGRRPGLRARRPPQPGQPAVAGRPGRARRLRGRGHEPPARSGPPALGDARRRGARGRAHGAGGQGAPRHPRRGERGVGAGGLPGPDAADPHCGAAARVEPGAAALQHADAAPRRVVAGPPAGIGRSPRCRPASRRSPISGMHNRELAGRGEQSPPGFFAAPRTSFNGAVSNRKRFAGLSVPLEDVKLVGRAFEATVNDVILACVSGGLRRLLADARGAGRGLAGGHGPGLDAGRGGDRGTGEPDLGDARLAGQ